MRASYQCVMNSNPNLLLFNFHSSVIDSDLCKNICYQVATSSHRDGCRFVIVAAGGSSEIPGFNVSVNVSHLTIYLYLKAVTL